MKKIWLCGIFLIFFEGGFASLFPAVEFKKEVCEELRNLEGWCSEDKALRFIELVLSEKPNLCVEIGVFGGGSLYPVAAALKSLNKGKVIGVDPWNTADSVKFYELPQEREHFEWWLSVDFDSIREAYRKMLLRNQLQDFVITIEATSEEAASQILEPIDILHIDGNPSEEKSLQDLSLYFPKVKSGGYIWLNDFGKSSKKKALEELFMRCKVIKIIDDGKCILFKKEEQDNHFHK